MVLVHACKTSNITCAKSTHPKQSTWQGRFGSTPPPASTYTSFVTLLSQLSTLLHGRHSKPNKLPRCIPLFFFCWAKLVRWIVLVSFSQPSFQPSLQLPHPPYLCLSINQFCQATNFKKTTQFLIQSYHSNKKKKTFAKHKMEVSLPHLMLLVVELWSLLWAPGY
jgi:hypothetical protein